MIFLMLIDTEEDKRKFVILYEKYRNLMMKVAFNVLQDRYLAEDAVHSAFVKLAKSMEKISEKELNTHNNDDIKVYVETFEGYAPLETVFQKGKEELYKEGKNYVEEQRELYENGEISLVATVDNYSV